ncbi:MAG: hypothetical protein II748_00130, partial [Clostridia bacterium]|nr:hypothetical protein [Clostridia bacterium]
MSERASMRHESSVKKWFVAQSGGFALRRERLQIKRSANMGDLRYKPSSAEQFMAQSGGFALRRESLQI